MDVIPLIVSGGAAAALIWIVMNIMGGKLRTPHEVEAKDAEIKRLRDDITDLKEINKAYAEAQAETNKFMEGLVAHANQAVELRQTKKLLEEALVKLDQGNA